MKSKLLLTMFMLIFSISAFAINSTLDMKGGIQYPSAADKLGFDSALTLNLGLDKYFTFGAESGFGWVQWKDKGDKVPTGPVTLTETQTTNLYSLPLLAVATIRLADLMESSGVMPYVSVGAGYSWTWYQSDAYKERFDGFTCQALGGLQFRLGADSNLKVLIEAGYRYAPIQNEKSIELDMSGAIARVGISFPIEPAN